MHYFIRSMCYCKRLPDSDTSLVEAQATAIDLPTAAKDSDTLLVEAQATAINQPTAADEILFKLKTELFALPRGSETTSLYNLRFR